jgi:hypothetical protein
MIASITPLLASGSYLYAGYTCSSCRMVIASANKASPVNIISSIAIPGACAIS